MEAPSSAGGPWVHLIVGPNGSGKSTLYTDVIGPATGLPFVNADVIAADLWPGEEAARSYDAAIIAAERRDELLNAGKSFATETVCSHPSKIEFLCAALAAGHSVSLHVVLVPEQLAVVRVPLRVDQGGHSVPEEKIRTRYQRMWPIVVEGVVLATEASIYDNSVLARPFDVVARFREGQIVDGPRWPQWTPHALRDPWD